MAVRKSVDCHVGADGHPLLVLWVLQKRNRCAPSAAVEAAHPADAARGEGSRVCDVVPIVCETHTVGVPTADEGCRELRWHFRRPCFDGGDGFAHRTPSTRFAARSVVLP